MKKLVITCLACAVAVIVSSQDHSCSFAYKHMEGTIGVHQAVFDLIITGNTIHGSSVSPDQKTDEGPFKNYIPGERLEGKLDHHGIATIEAYRQNISGGEYSGKLTDRYTGTFRDQRSGISSSFSLTEDYSGSIAFSGYCIKGDSALKDSIGSPFARIEYSIILPVEKDSFSFIRESILEASFGMEDLYELPDDSILTAFSNDYFRQYIESNIDIYEGGHSFNWEMIGTCAININRNDLLVYRVDNYGYTGGAHGMGMSRFLVFDTRNKERLHLADLFIEGFEPQLSQLLEDEYRARYFLDDDEVLSESGLFDDSIYPSENFYLTNNSVSFYYNPYELAPYAMGAITISLYHTNIRHLLKKDAVVNRLGW